MRNFVVKINRESKREFYLDAINKSEKNPKSLWNTINGLLGRSTHLTPTSVDCDGEVFTKSKDIANYFAKFFEEKVQKFRSEMIDAIDHDYASGSINKVMVGNNCYPTFEFASLSLPTVEGYLRNLANCKTSGVDNFESYLFNIISEIIAAPIMYILNCSFATSTFPDQWKIAKLCPIPKDRKKTFDAENSRPISVLNILSKLYEKAAFQQIKQYPSVNKIIVINQHAYRENHSMESALIQLTDNCLRNCY